MTKTYTLIIDHDGQENIREVLGNKYAHECFDNIKKDPLTFSVALYDEKSKQLKFWERK